jgi:hypothetical protein
MRGLWYYLERKKSARELLALLVPIAVAVVGGLWTIFTYVFPLDKPAKLEQPPAVTAGPGGVAAGGNISHSTIKIGPLPAPSAEAPRR